MPCKALKQILEIRKHGGKSKVSCSELGIWNWEFGLELNLRLGICKRYPGDWEFVFYVSRALPNNPSSRGLIPNSNNNF